MLPLRVRVDLRVMAMKGHFTILKTPASLEPNYHIHCHIRTLVGVVLHFCRDAVGLFCTSNWLGSFLERILTGYKHQYNWKEENVHFLIFFYFRFFSRSKRGRPIDYCVGRWNYKTEFSWFEFRVFLPLDLLWFGLVSFFYGVSSFMGYLMPNHSL